MAKTQKLKVFRTPAGFHDAYVPAPSQKAALEAWGADSNLFASGSAERVEDPELMREPLANPGKVIRRVRGTLAEHVAALPKKAKAESASPAKAAKAAKPGLRPAKPQPRPSRAALDRAEGAIADLEKRHAEATAALAKRQAELDRARNRLEAKQEGEQEKLQVRLEAARKKYGAAMQAWRDD